MALDPNAVSQKWLRGMQNSNQSMKDGVAAVTVAPGVSAAAASGLWLQRVTAAEPKFKANVQKVTLAQWQDKMTNVGIPRVATGAAANVSKVADFMTSFLPHVERIAQTVRAMPKGTIDQAVARAEAQIRGNATYKRP